MCSGRQQLVRRVLFLLWSTQSAGPLTPQHCNFRWTLSHAVTSSASDFLMDVSRVFCRTISRSDLKAIAAMPTANSIMKIIARHTANWEGHGKESCVGVSASYLKSVTHCAWNRSTGEIIKWKNYGDNGIYSEWVTWNELLLLMRWIVSYLPAWEGVATPGWLRSSPGMRPRRRAHRRQWER